MDDQDRTDATFGRSPTAPFGGPTDDVVGTVEDQLARAQERLAFYESFDGLIQENIARSGELLRQAMDMREAADREITLAREEAERARAEAADRVAADRARARSALNAVLDDLNALQQLAAGLARRVSTALADLGADDDAAAVDVAPTVDAESPPAFGRNDDLVAPASVPPLLGSVTPAATPDATEEPDDLPPGLRAPDAVPAVESVPEPVASSVFELTEPATVDHTDAGAGARDQDVLDDTIAPSPPTPHPDATSFPPTGLPAVSEDATGVLDGPLFDQAAGAFAPPESAPATGISGVEATAPLPAEAPDAAAFDAAPASDPNTARPIMVLVHGVPRAAAALSLQRHLAALGHVDAVEAREYAEGVLRLQVVSRGPLALDDLRRWEGGSGLEPLHVLDDVIEVRLPGAAGP